MKARPLTTQERLTVIAAVLLIWGVGIGARLAHLQVVDHTWYVARAIRQQERTVEVSATRGRILDTNGRELARSIEARSVYATVSEIKDPASTARRLAALLEVDEKTLLDRLTSDRDFVCLKRKLDIEAAEKVAALEIDGIDFVTENKRVYPKGELASHVLGFCGVDENGLSGLELTFDDAMRGQNGRVVLATDARRKIYDSAEIAPTPGGDLHLTIDEVAQYRVEQALAKGVRESGANWGIAIVIRPRTGEVVAMANYPTFDANAFGKTTGEVRRNRAVEAVFEPGSVFKIVPFSGCIEDGLIAPTTMVDCQYGQINVSGRIVHDTPYGVLKASDALAYSSNVAAIKMGQKLGNLRLYDYIKNYGFGRKTGIELPGESSGLVQPVEQWQPTTIGSIPMGHEIGVTALQEVAAVAALANGGEWVQPHLVSRVVAPDGIITRAAAPDRRRVVSPETARMMTGMLEGVVIKGTAKHAGLSELSAAGKTGTSQKIDPRTKTYSHSKYVASFCGYAPAENPELACIVVLDEPKNGGHTGGAAAAPIFGRILEELFSDYAIPTNPAPVEIASANPSRSGGTQLAAVESVPPAAPAAPVAPEIAVVEAKPGTRGVIVPDLAGKGLRSALQIGADSGLLIEANGSGIVRKQSPQAGAVVAPGTVLTVELKR
ncbi:MAG: PASTA domain-containing protein [Blastocatellia bacterium]|jgi:cell division protein FtsI (penicillin-binding protein 3)|nr:PASTA domain-containing protein [Blastocatellia bacterium]